MKLVNGAITLPNLMSVNPELICIHCKHVINEANGSRMSITIIRVCVDSVCLSKTAETTITKPVHHEILPTN